jgi:methionyl-tRNA formyltransferase
MQMDKGFDTGDVILRKRFELDETINLQELHDFTARIGAELLLETVQSIESLPRFKQDESQATYAHKLTKEEGRINWSDSAIAIHRKMRGMTPWPGVYFEYNGNIIKIRQADYLPMLHDFKPGTVIDSNLRIACGFGFLSIRELQLAGKKPLSTQDFLLGFSIPEGSIVF